MTSIQCPVITKVLKIAVGSQVIKGADPFILIVGSFTAEQAKDTLDGFLNMVHLFNSV